MPVKLVLLMLLTLLVAEIGLFIGVAAQIGVWAAMGLAVATSVAGALLLRQAGRKTFGRLRRGAFATSRVTDIGPGTATLFRALGGILLLLPGFLTDALGAALLLPAVQKRVRTGFERLLRPTLRTKPESTVIDLDPSEWERRAGNP